MDVDHACDQGSTFPQSHSRAEYRIELWGMLVNTYVLVGKISQPSACPWHCNRRYSMGKRGKAPPRTLRQSYTIHGISGVDAHRSRLLCRHPAHTDSSQASPTGFISPKCKILCTF